MGINYYAIRPLSKEEEENVIKSVKSKDYNTAKQILEKKTNPIHIGKASHGWKFLFDTNNEKYYELNKESINNFINSGVILQDESGEIITPTEFWVIVDELKNGKDNNTYYSANLSRVDQAYTLLDERIPYQFKKYNPQYYEFYSDGLRFSTNIDFC